MLLLAIDAARLNGTNNEIFWYSMSWMHNSLISSTLLQVLKIFTFMCIKITYQHGSSMIR